MSIEIKDAETMRVYIAHAILKKLKAHRPPNDPLRFDCESHSEMVNLHWDRIVAYQKREPVKGGVS